MKLRRVAIRLDCPCLNDFAAGLLDRVEATKFAVDIETGLFEEFTLRGFERLLAVGDFSLRYGPCDAFLKYKPPEKPVPAFISSPQLARKYVNLLHANAKI